MISIRSARRQRVDVAESGALSDLAFLLIVFFIVIAVFNVKSGFLLGLPLPGSVTTVYTDDLMRVRVSQDDRFFVGGTEVSVEEIGNLVETRRRTQPNMTLMVQLDPESTYQSLVTLVELARVLDVDNFSFAMTGKSGIAGDPGSAP